MPKTLELCEDLLEYIQEQEIRIVKNEKLIAKIIQAIKKLEERINQIQG